MSVGLRTHCYTLLSATAAATTTTTTPTTTPDAAADAAASAAHLVPNEVRANHHAEELERLEIFLSLHTALRRFDSCAAAAVAAVAAADTGSSRRPRPLPAATQIPGTVGRHPLVHLHKIRFHILATSVRGDGVGGRARAWHPSRCSRRVRAGENEVAGDHLPAFAVHSLPVPGLPLEVE